MRISEILHGAAAKLEVVMVPGKYAEDFAEALAAVRAVARAVEISERKSADAAKEGKRDED